MRNRNAGTNSKNKYCKYPFHDTDYFYLYCSNSPEYLGHKHWAVAGPTHFSYLTILK